MESLSCWVGRQQWGIITQGPEAGGRLIVWQGTSWSKEALRRQGREASSGWHLSSPGQPAVPSEARAALRSHHPENHLDTNKKCQSQEARKEQEKGPYVRVCRYSCNMRPPKWVFPSLPHILRTQPLQLLLHIGERGPRWTRFTPQDMWFHEKGKLCPFQVGDGAQEILFRCQNARMPRTFPWVIGIIVRRSQECD